MMNIPTNKSLATWIRELIAQDKVMLFYQTEEWKSLRKEVLEEHYNECVECAKKGRYTRAECVHHVNEVRNAPHLALSKYYTDATGKKHRNLVPLCNVCHNQVHSKFEKWQQSQKKYNFVNEEKWE